MKHENHIDTTYHDLGFIYTYAGEVPIMTCAAGFSGCCTGGILNFVQDFALVHEGV